ncbi:MAG: riboflavin biosynthesis protein RibF [Oscillospiraceae bacterium]|nr:riboflavin biosynthesis protein RibF [Oscillospiraceae bacterium]
MDKGRVIALGFFDGVHLGHAALLRTARQAAARRGVPAAALTFDRPPGELVSGTPVPLINTPGDRAGLMRRLCGIDEVLLCRFDRAMMEMPWESYVEDYLIGRLRAVHVVCGFDHRFGYRGQGTAERLREACARLGAGCDVTGEVSRRGVKVSSTHIRSLLSSGQIEEANQFLGHPHCLTGTVVHGRQLGRQLGTPTANVLLPPGVLSPAFGVYAALACFDGRAVPAVTNIGVRPTVRGGDQVTAEPWLLDFDGDLYGKELRIEFYRFLRPEQKFPSLEALRAAILQNAQETRDFFRP